MCAVSNVGDYYGNQWQQQYQGGTGITIPAVGRAEFDQLRAEVLEMKRLLLMAKEIDNKTGQTDCEMESKVKILKAVAEAVGVSLEGIFVDSKKESK